MDELVVSAKDRDYYTQRKKINYRKHIDHDSSWLADLIKDNGNQDDIKRVKKVLIYGT